MQYWINTSKFFVALVFVFTQLISTAQENSPYTRYGLGNIKTTENIANRLMGGIALGDNNNLMVNPSNPATYAHLWFTSYNVGMDAVRGNVKSSTATNQTGYASLNYATFGVKAAKNIGLSFGLLPQYSGKYNMQKLDTLFGKYARSNNFYGSGSVQRIYGGVAYKYQNFSAGLNIGYTFGSTVRSNESDFVDSDKILYNHQYGRTTVSGIFLQGGALYVTDYKEKYQLRVGLSYTLQQNLRSKREEYNETYIGDINDPLYRYRGDSLINVKGKIIVPAVVGVGALFSEGDHWSVGMDLVTSDWSKFRNNGSVDSTGASWTLKLGGSFTPEVNNTNNIWRRSTYRIGAYTGKDIYVFNGTSLSRTAVTFGMGLPIKKWNTGTGVVNAGFEIGQRGTTNNGLLQEGFTRFMVGVTLNDKWFIKRRYD
jgi:hypothetical protein